MGAEGWMWMGLSVLVAGLWVVGYKAGQKGGLFSYGKLDEQNLDLLPCPPLFFQDSNFPFQWGLELVALSTFSCVVSRTVIVSEKGCKAKRQWEEPPKASWCWYLEGRQETKAVQLEMSHLCAPVPSKNQKRWIFQPLQVSGASCDMLPWFLLCRDFRAV